VIREGVPDRPSSRSPKGAVEALGAVGTRYRIV